jgi:vacuolar protein sorting-associated protein 13A/C
MLLRNITRQLTLQSMRLLTGVDILADASDTLSQISGSIANFTGDKHWQERSSSRRMMEETSMAGALVHGGEAMAAGLFRGITGLVTKPVEGARDEGLSGFLTGIGKGFAGLVLQPVSGAVDLASKAVEGVNASKANVVDMVREGGSGHRRRPPLAISSSGVIRRYDRKAAEGQAILRQAEWRAVGSAGGVVDRLDLFKTRSKFGKDTYEWHEELPDGRIALVTNARALLLERPFASADLLTERCSISWAVDLSEILSAEAVAAPAASGSAAGGAAVLPSLVVLQLRTKTKDRMLSGAVALRVFTCAPGTEQATRLHAAIRDGLLDLSAQVGMARHGSGAGWAGQGGAGSAAQ